jgi:hypothetical protein
MGIDDAFVHVAREAEIVGIDDELETHTKKLPA